MKPGKKEIASAALELHGGTFAEELGIDLAKGGPSELFRLLCAALLMSARIRYTVALQAARAVANRGWTSPDKLARSSWEERVAALDEAHYVRYDERTATMLADAAKLLLERYGGDLRRLREEAGGNPTRERKLLKEFKGIGDVGADIFLREVQAGWDEVAPFADRRALEAAQKLGLGRDVEALADLVGRDDFPRLVAALVRVGLEDDYDAVLEAAKKRA